MNKRTDPKSFWENKILTWENGRYKEKESSSSMLENIANKSSNSLRFRLEITKVLLKDHIIGKSVFEIGCGSGMLAKDLVYMGARQYVGYDFAASAIEKAKLVAQEQNITDKASFFEASVLDLPDLEADVVFSLGLVDWLDDDEIAHLFKVGQQAHFLHAFSEKRFSVSQMIHRLYVFVSYGHKTNGYQPRYQTTQELADIANKYNNHEAKVYRNPQLSFGALFTSLPIVS
ncbi:MAG: hypothetical protein CFH06_00153 [Alphaproteobacteria bacterium MarineAlpha3_Bin5]|nr:MAG: hypothetical protein CFH06_00153 [Alphaproteobacteria bacterium MarineAlpha3_Bin5]